jgi:hypothetical protein
VSHHLRVSASFFPPASGGTSRDVVPRQCLQRFSACPGRAEVMPNRLSASKMLDFADESSTSQHYPGQHLRNTFADVFADSGLSRGIPFGASKSQPVQEQVRIGNERRNCKSRLIICPLMLAAAKNPTILLSVLDISSQTAERCASGRSPASERNA